MSIKSVKFSNISATTSAFQLGAGNYGVTVMGSSFGTVTLERLCADGSTYVACMTAFSTNGYASAYLPAGQYVIAVSSTTGVYVEIAQISYGTN